MKGQLPLQKKAPISRLKPYDVEKAVTSISDWPLNEQASAYVLMFGESIGWWGQRTYTGHSISHKGDVWWLTVRATHKGKAQVCFVSGSTQAEAIKTFAVGLVYEQLQWREDRFKP